MTKEESRDLTIIQHYPRLGRYDTIMYISGAYKMSVKNAVILLDKLIK